jgi:hypothetical protein
MPTDSHRMPTKADTMPESSLRWRNHFRATADDGTARRVAEGGRDAGAGCGGAVDSPVMAASTFCLSIPASESALTTELYPYFFGMRSLPQPGLPHLDGPRVVISGWSGHE